MNVNFQIKDLCRQMTKTDKNLHKYFQSLGQIIGFDKDHLVSIYDIPSMFRPSAEIKKSYAKEAFLYSQCPQGTLSNSGFNECYRQYWSLYLINNTIAHPCKITPECCHFWTKVVKNR